MYIMTHTHIYTHSSPPPSHTHIPRYIYTVFMYIMTHTHIYTHMTHTHIYTHMSHTAANMPDDSSITREAVRIVGDATIETAWFKFLNKSQLGDPCLMNLKCNGPIGL